MIKLIENVNFLLHNRRSYNVKFESEKKKEKHLKKILKNNLDLN